MKKLTENRFFWMAISFLLALLLWGYVTSTENDEVTRTFSGVSLELLGADSLKESRNLVITDLSADTVTFSITGPRRVLSSLGPQDLKAQIDVSKLSQSAYASMQYSISYPNGTDTSDLNIGRKIPEYINFNVSAMIEKEIPVRGSFDGSVAEGYVSEAPVFEPSSITISGAESKLGDISYAWVSFGDEEIRSSFTQLCSFTLYSEEGEECSSEGISFSTEEIYATLPILTVKEVPLDVNLIYGAGANEENVTVKIEPETITLSGDSSILDGLNRIVLGTIDLSSFETTFEESFSIVVDSALNNVTGISEAQVKIEISGLETRLFNVSNFDTVNLTEGFSAEIQSQIIQIRLRGTTEQLDLVKEENIRAVADLEDYDETTGLQYVPVKIYVDGSTEVGALSTAKIYIEIRRIN